MIKKTCEIFVFYFWRRIDTNFYDEDCVYPVKQLFLYTWVNKQTGWTKEVSQLN